MKTTAQLWWRVDGANVVEDVPDGRLIAQCPDPMVAEQIVHARGLYLAEVARRLPSIDPWGVDPEDMVE